MGHERDITGGDRCTGRRAGGGNASPAERSRVEGLLSGALGRLFAVAEAYPDLKANTTFLEFQGALQTVEDEIQLSRRYYNGTVRNLNVAVESFPSNFIANMFKFTKAEYFELENEADRATPQVKFQPIMAFLAAALPRFSSR